MASRLFRNIPASICKLNNFNTSSRCWIRAFRFRPTSVIQPNLNKSQNGLIRNYCSNQNEIMIPVVSYEQVKDLPNHPEVTLVDVREPNELQETGIIPTSINIPLGDIPTAFGMSDRQFKTKYQRNKPDLSDEIIFHCKIGKRSESAAIAVSKIGYTNLKNYKGSWNDWAEREKLPK